MVTQSEIFEKSNKYMLTPYCIPIKINNKLIGDID